jgi:small GTP-binding protein
MKKIYKIITAGEGGVGKTTLLHRYIHDVFLQDSQMTIGVEFFKKELEMDEDIYELVIWDFGGQEQFRKILSIYASGLNGALLMFDLSNIKRSLRNLDFWWTLLNRWGEVPIILIGTKHDLINEKQYSLYKDLITEAIKKYDFVEYVKTSSKDGLNINKTFEVLVEKIEAET